ncbi:MULTISPECIES: AAA+ family ATPase [Falsihalocynthiibacter]|uniref:AAA+ family ATPase n=1 Tax=Falsihalocynthiibacter TaxID=2854182 RepID=UPI003001FC5E
MRHFCFAIVAASFVAFPSIAERQGEPDGADLLEQGLQLLFKELLSQIEPALKDFETFGDELGPKVQELIEMIDDFRNYEAPEKMPNGDIIIRRIRPLKEGEIEL